MFINILDQGIPIITEPIGDKVPGNTSQSVSVLYNL